VRSGKRGGRYYAPAQLSYPVIVRYHAARQLRLSLDASDARRRRRPARGRLERYRRGAHSSQLPIPVPVPGTDNPHLFTGTERTSTHSLTIAPRDGLWPT